MSTRQMRLTPAPKDWDDVRDMPSEELEGMDDDLLITLGSESRMAEVELSDFKLWLEAGRPGWCFRMWRERQIKDLLASSSERTRTQKGRKEGWRTFALLLVLTLVSQCVFNRERDKAELGLMNIMEEARGELKKVIREVERMPATEEARDELVEDLEEVDFILNMERFADE